MMRNRGLMIAAALAMSMPGLGGMPGSQLIVAQPPSSPQGQSGPVPQGGIGTLLGDVLRHRGGGGGAWGRPNYKKLRGPGHLAAKRLKRRARNRLRAKRQFRKAVR